MNTPSFLVPPGVSPIKETVPKDRERLRRYRIRLSALKRHAAARDPLNGGKSALAVRAGKSSGLKREGDRAWGLELALRRWYPRNGSNRNIFPKEDSHDKRTP